MVKKARALKKEHGILAEPKPKSGRALSKDVVDFVINFYCDDQYSRMCAGKKECLTVKVDGQKEKFQKPLLLLNIWEVFLEFKKVNPDVQIGFSKFCELGPKYVVNVNSSSMHKVYVYEYHQNIKLMLLFLPVKIDYKDVICKAACNINTRNCMLLIVCENNDNKSKKLLQNMLLGI